MSVVLLVCGIAALVAALPAGALLPGTRAARDADGTPGLVAPTADARQ